MSKPFETLLNPKFDLGTAIFLAEASQAAYAAEVDPKEWSEAQGMTFGKSFDRSNVQGFWATAGSVALLAFRGTSNTGQWIRDARFFPVSHPWGRIHAGFRDGVADVEQDLAFFDAVLKPSTTIWITGHSLGGALALVAAARLKMKGFSSRLNTFGQPRVGLSGFADRFSVELPGSLYRFVNQSDIVTRLPPGLFYSHTGILKRIVKPGVLHTELESALENVNLSTAGKQALRLATGSNVLESANSLESSGLAAPGFIDSELPPLSEEQFAALQMALAEGSSDGGPKLEGAELEGAVPFVADHAITEYIRLLMEIRDQ